MNDEGPDPYLLIGLHKLAAEQGDTLVPELYELLRQRELQRMDYPNVLDFPLWRTRRPGEVRDHQAVENLGTGSSVVEFQVKTGKIGMKNKKS